MAAGQVRNYITYATTLLTVRKNLVFASSGLVVEAVLRSGSADILSVVVIASWAFAGKGS